MTIMRRRRRRRRRKNHDSVMIETVELFSIKEARANSTKAQSTSNGADNGKKSITRMTDDGLECTSVVLVWSRSIYIYIHHSAVN